MRYVALPERVFQAFTDAKKLFAWRGKECSDSHKTRPCGYDRLP